MAGVNGDYYLNTTTGDLFQKQDSSWVKIGNLKGAQGPEGPQGDKGDTGAAGATWLNGSGDPT